MPVTMIARITAVVASVSFIASAPSIARLGPKELVWFIDEADAIVVADVTQVDSDSARAPRAFLEIREVWKGKVSPSLWLDTRRTWTCDSSRAVQGERVLLFLDYWDDSKPPRIFNSGRGRFVIVEIDGTDYTETSLDSVIMPRNVHPEDFTRTVGSDVLAYELSFQRVELKDLKSFVESWLRPR